MKKRKIAWVLITALMLLTGCTGNKEAAVENTSNPNEKYQKIEYLAKPQFDAVGYGFIDGIMMVEVKAGQGTKKGFINDKGDIIVQPIYDDAKYFIGARSASSGFAEGLAPVKKGEKWGYINLLGEEATKFVYDEAGLFRGDIAAVKMNGKWGFINKTDELIVPAKYQTAYAMQGVGIVESNGKWGFIDNRGNWILNNKFDFIDISIDTDENDKYAKITDKELQGLVKVDNGKVDKLIEPKYTKLYPFIDGKAFYVIIHRDKDGSYINQKSYGYVDLQGKEIYRWDNTSLELYQLSEGRLAVENGMGMFGYIDTEMNTVVPLKYEAAEAYNKGRAIAAVDKRYGVINKEGNWILQPQYDSIVDLNSYFIVKDSTGEYLINSENLTQMSDKYDEIGRGETLKAVREGGKVGFISLKGEEVISPQYDDCESFAFWEGYAIVKKGQEWFYINERGQRIGDMTFEAAGMFGEADYAAVMKAGKWGIINKECKLVVPYAFEEIPILQNNLAIVLEAGKYGVVRVK